jgi:hypothetical protein
VGEQLDKGGELKALTYLIYIVLWEGMVIGGTGYAVFVLGHSGWWFLLSVALSINIYSPGAWAQLKQ